MIEGFFFPLLQELVHTQSHRLLFYFLINLWQNPSQLQNEQDQTCSQDLAALGKIP